MRINVYAEELNGHVQIISKEVEGQTFTGLRFWLYLPVTVGGRAGRHRSMAGPRVYPPINGQAAHVAGPFMHRPDDDDSSAVTFWGKRDLRKMLRKALALLVRHYAKRRPTKPRRKARR